MFFELISLNAFSIRPNLLNEIPQWVSQYILSLDCNVCLESKFDSNKI